MRLITNELLARLDTLKIPSRRRISSKHRGEKNSQRKGSSLEFSDYREYLPGDDIRNIDWNTYARTERLYLKLFFEEESRRVFFIVDGSESMNFGTPTKFEYALSLASCLAYISLRRYDWPQILVLRDRSFHRFPFRSQAQYFSVLQRLQKERTEGQTHLSISLRKMAYSGFGRSTFFILSDFYSYDGLQGLKLLATAGNEICCLQVLTPEETNPAMRGDVRLVDSETSDRADVSVSPLSLRRYLERMRALQELVRSTAHQSMANYYSISISKPLESLLLQDLRKAGILE